MYVGIGRFQRHNTELKSAQVAQIQDSTHILNTLIIRVGVIAQAISVCQTIIVNKMLVLTDLGVTNSCTPQNMKSTEFKQKIPRRCHFLSS